MWRHLLVLAGLLGGAGIGLAAAQTLPWQAIASPPANGPAANSASKPLPWQAVPVPAAVSPPPAAQPAPPPTRKPVPKRATTPAKQLFGAVKSAARLPTQAIGFYSKGCLAGAAALPVSGPQWQAMRLSRHRNWGHPLLVAFIEKFARDAKRLDNWPGLLVGDMSQPRGGPMLTGHASHQIGLDVDLWYDGMPSRRLTAAERETTSASNMLADATHVNPSRFTAAHVALLRRAASYAEVERVLVHPAVKKALCEAAGENREFLKKIRPFWGHDDHFHLRIGCPADSPGCQKQTPTTGEDGCGKELDEWFALLTRKPEPPPAPPATPVKPKPPMSLDDMPAACRAVLSAAPAAARPPKK